MNLPSGISGVTLALPVRLDDFKAFIRQFASHEDAMLTDVLRGAVRTVENYLQVELTELPDGEKLDPAVQTGVFLLAQSVVEKRIECAEAAYAMLSPYRTGMGI